MLKVAPLTEASVRIPTAVIGILDVFLIYAVARRLFHGPLYPALAALILALSPAHFIFSRQALDYICPLPFVLGWLWCLLASLQNGQRLAVARRRAPARRRLLQLHRGVGDDAAAAGTDMGRAARQPAARGREHGSPRLSALRCRC